MTGRQPPGESAATRHGRVSPTFTMLAAATLVVLTACAAAVTVWKMHEQVDRDARANLGQLALVIADQTSRSFQSVETVLREIVERVSEDGLNISNGPRAGLGSEAVHEFLVDQARHLPQIGNLILINAAGALINHSRGWPARSLLLGDSEQFHHLRDHDDEALFISEPVRNMVDGTWAIYLARRINGPHDEFLGVAEAAVLLDHFVEFYRTVDTGEGSAIALWRRDGTLLARHPMVESQIGRLIGPQPLFGEMEKYVDRGGFWTLSPVDGVPRYVAFRAVRGFPLLVATSLTVDVALGQWRRDAAILLVGALGAVSGVLMLLRTLTGQIRRIRRSEDLLAVQNLKLARSEQLLLEAQRIGKVGHWVSDAAGVAVWSPQLFEIAGLPQMPDVPFETMVLLVHPEDIERFRRVREEALARRTKMIHEHRWIRPDGQYRWVRLEADPRFDAEGEFLGMFGVVQDVTAAELAKSFVDQWVADLERAQDRLEAQKQELIATTGDLRAARDAAESASRAKTEFLAMMSHEIRTPMTGMMLMIGMLCDTPLNEEQQHFAAVARESAHDLLGVVNNILDFSKLEAGKLITESIGFSLQHVIEGVALLVGPKARGEDLRLDISLSNDMPAWLSGDPNRIRQILLNLTGNAVKFTERGSIHITAAHHALAGDLIELRFEVIDSGIGISKGVQDRLFTPFTQADTSVSRKYGGTGLGLAICKQLCLAMGGTIGVNSVLGHGSRFWFTVQCKRGEAPTVSAPPLQPASAEAERALSILVADDNPMIRTLTSTLLSKRGHRAELVCSGREAVAAVRGKSYDMVVMDLQMPEMDGLSAAKAIRALTGPERHVPIIALTGNAIVGQREICLAAGMNDYLPKPFEPADFYAAIARCAALDARPFATLATGVTPCARSTHPPSSPGS
jgi:PAS domain S-box-containing protein